jgi:hypothetical protein
MARRLKKDARTYGRYSPAQGSLQNATIPMRSTCLTNCFSRDLVSDTLLVSPAMPKRSPKCNHPAQKYQDSIGNRGWLLPSLNSRPPLQSNREPWKEEEDVKGRILPPTLERLAGGRQRAVGE